MSKKIFITGGTGFMGKHIIKKLIERGDSVFILTRNPDKVKALYGNESKVEAINSNEIKSPEQLSKVFEETDVIINLAGANVGDKRWTKEYKEEIYNSRIETTKLIVESIKLCKNKPELLISASGVGIYGFCGEEKINEESDLGKDFLAKVCTDWENEAVKAEESGVRVALIRTGIVLGKNEGALKELMLPFKFFIGAYQGNGKQWLSWIHIEDIVNLYLFVIDNIYLNGAINGTSPNPVRNKEFIETISKFKKTFFIAPVPGFIMKLIAGEFAENLLTGQKVYPEKAIDSGYAFKYSDLNSALKNLLKD